MSRGRVGPFAVRVSLLVGVLSLAACNSGAGGPAPAERALKVGQLAPEFELTTVHGRTVVLAEALRAGPVALIFGSYT